MMLRMRRFHDQPGVVRPSRQGSTSVGLLSLVVILLVTLFGPVTPAGAWAPAETGQPGKVELPKVSVTDLKYSWQPTTLTFLSDVGPTANRSPAHAGAQTIILLFIIQRLDDQQNWVVVSKKDLSSTITAQQPAVSFPAVYIQPTVSTAGAYRFVFSFGWYIPPTMAPLGTSDWTADHVCVTPLRTCTSNGTYVQLGGLTPGR
ncbi:hypothetical protein [Streptomyces sp. NBC_00239]|uniref:hypothetical protein n=1 Tax=Streptomyces sp. NBC_00239 TaxID=2903640 RepID=UPI002E2CD4BB|nr:hypothetical protein [Streptomyces sp. NBC_00239]